MFLRKAESMSYVLCKNSSAYFDNKMIEEEEMENQVNDGTFDECAYVKDDDNLCA